MPLRMQIYTINKGPIMKKIKELYNRKQSVLKRYDNEDITQIERNNILSEINEKILQQVDILCEIERRIPKITIDQF